MGGYVLGRGSRDVVLRGALGWESGGGRVKSEKLKGKRKAGREFKGEENNVLIFDKSGLEGGLGGWVLIECLDMWVCGYVWGNGGMDGGIVGWMRGRF